MNERTRTNGKEGNVTYLYFCSAGIMMLVENVCSITSDGHLICTICQLLSAILLGTGRGSNIACGPFKLPGGVPELDHPNS